MCELLLTVLEDMVLQDVVEARYSRCWYCFGLIEADVSNLQSSVAELRNVV